MIYYWGACSPTLDGVRGLWGEVFNQQQGDFELKMVVSEIDFKLAPTLLYGSEDYEKVAKELKDQSGGTGVCAGVLKTGSVAWRCETCQTDPQAILCQACYENSDHTGHKIWLKTNVGGCCDCGNPDAFKKEGWCTKHQGFESSNEAFIASLSPYLKVSSP